MLPVITAALSTSLPPRLGHKCPSTFNPADFYIHTLAVQPGHELRSRERIKRICDNFAVSAYAKDVELIIQYQDNRFLQFEDTQVTASARGCEVVSTYV